MTNYENYDDDILALEEKRLTDNIAVVAAWKSSMADAFARTVSEYNKASDGFTTELHAIQAERMRRTYEQRRTSRN